MWFPCAVFTEHSYPEAGLKEEAFHRSRVSGPSRTGRRCICLVLFLFEPGFLSGSSSPQLSGDDVQSMFIVLSSSCLGGGQMWSEALPSFQRNKEDGFCSF